MCIIKANGSILTLSDIVSVGVYEFEKYEILGNTKDRNSLRNNVFVVGHADGEKPFEANIPIEPTGTIVVSNRDIFDSLLILASEALPIVEKKSHDLILLWCKKYGLPFCSVDASKQNGYLAFPLYKFYDFLFSLRDTFLKVESMHEDFTVEHDIDANFFDENPYKRQNSLSDYFTEEIKRSLIAEFINEANLSLRFEYRSEIPTFYNYAEDIISLVKYQFALILVSNSERVPRRCKCCGSMFFAHRKNQLYGPCCSRQKRYAAERRRREKELKKRG